MTIAIYWIIIGLLSVALAVTSGLAWRRVRADRRRLQAIQRLDVTQFCDLLLTNSHDGTIQVVASKVSDLLRNEFGCDRVIFLRKQRGYLELNYYYGIRNFTREEFRLRFSAELAEEMRTEFRPRPVARIAEIVPHHFCQLLDRHQLDFCFPIFWRQNLYGLYFVHSRKTPSSELLTLLMAVVAQTFSAAYHVKWHEEKLEKTQRKLNRLAANNIGEPLEESSRVLRLIRHRNPDAIIKEMFDSIRADLDLPRAAFIYRTGDERKTLRVLCSQNLAGLQSLSGEGFDEFLEQIDRGKPVAVGQLNHRFDSDLTRRLNASGLHHLMHLTLSPERAGLFAWSGRKTTDEIAERVQGYRNSAEVLVSNAESYARVKELSNTDVLTGLANQRYFRKRLREEIDRAKRYNRFLALIIIDMDHLKVINDNHGHQAGDAVIQKMGHLLRSSIRAIDIVARYGGDEFCVIMPESDATTCQRFMARVQQRIARARFTAPTLSEELVCTISLGGAVFPQHAEQADRLIYAADMALLKAKEQGRNASRLYQPAVAESGN